MAKITDLDDQQKALENILNTLDELCKLNKNLQGFIKIQKDVKELEKEHNKSLSWFKKLVNTVSNIKYAFVKSEEKLTKEAIEQNNKLLKRIDNTILSIVDKSSTLKQTLQQEIKKNFEDLAGKTDLSEKQRKSLSNLFYNEYAAKGEKFASPTMVKALHFSSAEELENQHNDLNAIRQNVLNLLTENSNIKELKEIKKQVAEIRAEIPFTFFEKLTNSWQKIKNIFVNNNEQILAKNIKNNIKAIEKIDQKLHEAEDKFKKLINDKEKSIIERAGKISKDTQLKVDEKIVDFKTRDLNSPIIQDEASKTQSEKSKFATVGKPHRATNIAKTNLESFEPKDNSISNTEKTSEKLSDSNSPISNFPNEKPAMTFSTFREKNDEILQSVEQIKENMTKAIIPENSVDVSKKNPIKGARNAKLNRQNFRG